jgi:hypothetical protein
MPYFYLIFVGLTLLFPQTGHEAGLVYEQNIFVEENALIDQDALSYKGGFGIPDILNEIAQCESGNRQFDASGNIVTGKSNPHDIGRYQINKLYWQEKADELGHDLYTEAGNEGVALYLYNRYGTDPWKHSKFCWGEKLAFQVK